MIFDNHIHIAPFSHDATQSVQAVLDHAGKIGLAGVMTADHYEKDLFYAHGEDIFSVSDYFDMLKPVRNRRPADACRLLTGIEIGYLPHLADHLAELTSKWPFDGVILSLHILDGRDPYIESTIYPADKKIIYARYLEVMCEMAKACPDFDILGHFDYISRYGPYPERKMYYADFQDHFDTIFNELIPNGKALEINTRSVIKLKSVGYEGVDAWPDSAIIRRFTELGGIGICLGSDAHHLPEPGQLFQEGCEWLKSVGIRCLVHYENRKPVFDCLD